MGTWIFIITKISITPCHVDTFNGRNMNILKDMGQAYFKKLKFILDENLVCINHIKRLFNKSMGGIVKCTAVIL